MVSAGLCYLLVCIVAGVTGDACKCRSTWSYYEDGSTCDQPSGCTPLNEQGKSCDGSEERWCIVDEKDCDGSTSYYSTALQGWYADGNYMTCDSDTPVAEPLPDCKCKATWTDEYVYEFPHFDDANGRTCDDQVMCAQPKMFDYDHRVAAIADWASSS